MSLFVVIIRFIGIPLCAILLGETLSEILGETIGKNLATKKRK